VLPPSTSAEEAAKLLKEFAARHKAEGDGAAHGDAKPAGAGDSGDAALA
jgi:hypothetical protein